MAFLAPIGIALAGAGASIAGAASAVGAAAAGAGAALGGVAAFAGAGASAYSLLNQPKVSSVQQRAVSALPQAPSPTDSLAKAQADAGNRLRSIYATGGQTTFAGAFGGMGIDSGQIQRKSLLGQ